MSGPPRRRVNGDGSIFPYRNGWAAYVWVTTPAGTKDRKYVYGQDREKVHGEWVELQAKAKKMPIPTTTPTVAEYLAYWLEDVIRPNREASTYTAYEVMSRLHIVPGIGSKKTRRSSLYGSRRHGSTSSPEPASAARRGRTPGARNRAAAPLARAARITPGGAPSRRRAAPCARRSTPR